MVNNKEITDSCLFPEIIEWCVQVTVAPEVNNNNVFNKGNPNAEIGSIPIGGHTHPIAIVGAKLEWKNPQKNATKKHYFRNDK